MWQLVPHWGKRVGESSFPNPPGRQSLPGNFGFLEGAATTLQQLVLRNKAQNASCLVLGLSLRWSGNFSAKGSLRWKEIDSQHSLILCGSLFTKRYKCPKWRYLNLIRFIY